MAETITIDGRAIPIDELIEDFGLDLDPPYSAQDIADLRSLLDAANNDRSVLSELLGAAALVGIALSLPGLRTGVTYSTATGRYAIDGTVITQAGISQLILREQQAVAARNEALARRLINGQISLEEYGDRMGENIVRSHLRLAQLGAGGRGQLTQAQIEQFRQRLLGDPSLLGGSGIGEIEALANHLASIKSGNLTPGQILARARQYGFNSAVTYHEARHLAMVARGTFAIRVLDSGARHCPECPGYEQRQWLPADQIVPVGTACSCRGRCRCAVIYRTSPLNEFDTANFIQSVGTSSLNVPLRDVLSRNNIEDV